MKLFTLSLLIGSLGFMIHTREVRAQAATEYMATNGMAAGIAGKVGNKLTHSADRNLSSLSTDMGQEPTSQNPRELVNGARMYPRGK